MCWVNIVIAIVMMIVGEILRPKQKSNTGKPAGLGDFQFPTSEAGRVFSWFVGTVKVLGPNVTARDDLSTKESYKRVKTGWFSTAKQSYGFQYRIGLQMVIASGGTGKGIDKVWGFQVNDKFLKTKSITETEHYFDVLVDDPAYYGDAMKDGGFAGLIRVYRGTDGQPVDEYLRTKLLHEDESSAYPGVCHAIFNHFYIGMSANPPPVLPVLSRWPNSLGVPDGKHLINETASNVICAVYDYMTDIWRGLGISPSRIDLPAFMAAALVCYDEGIGVNIILDSVQNGEDAVKSMMAYADGVVFEDPFRAIWTIKLARADYDIDTLPILNEDNSRCVGRSKSSWPDTKNTFSIGYLDKDKNWTNQSVMAYDQGNLIAQNMQNVAMDVTMNGVDNAALANFMAERTRVANATPFTHLDIEAQGLGDTLKQNDVFVASYPTRRIDRMVMRVTDIEYANTDDGVTKIKALEDKYGVAHVAYSGLPVGGWTPPVLVPASARYQTVMELPYAMTPGVVQERFALTAVARDGILETGYGVYINGEPVNIISDLTSAGKLVAPLLATGPYSGNISFSVHDVSEPEEIVSATPEEFALGLSLVKIDDELIAFQTVTDNGDGTLTLTKLARAVYDTLPADHAADTPVFFLGSGAGLAQDLPFAADVLLAFKLPLRVGGDEQALAEVPELPLQLVARAKRPYAPAALRVNGTLAVAGGLAVNGPLTLTWANRNRLDAGVALVDYLAADVTPEDGVMAGASFYRTDDNTLLIAKDDMAGTTAGIVLGYTGTVRMEFYSVNQDGLKSYSRYSVLLDYTPPPGTVASSIDAATWEPTYIVHDGGEIT